MYRMLLAITFINKLASNYLHLRKEDLCFFMLLAQQISPIWRHPSDEKKTVFFKIKGKTEKQRSLISVFLFSFGAYEHDDSRNYHQILR